MKLLRSVLSVAAVAVLALPALATATSAQRNFQGPFMQADAQVRCQLSSAWAQCVSMQTGRVAIVRSSGIVATYRTSDAIAGGTVPRAGKALFARGNRLGCIIGGGDVTCEYLPTHSSFTMNAWSLLPKQFGVQGSFVDDSPAVAPIPYGYVPPVTANPYSSTIPDYSDPGGTYGSISTVTGLPRIYYVSPYTKQDGTFVSGYYRSCSRC